MRFATGGEDQAISEHKAIEKAIELSSNVHKADPIQVGSLIKRQSGRQRPHGLIEVRYRRFATEPSLVSSLRQDSCCQKYPRQKRQGFGLRRR